MATHGGVSYGSGTVNLTRLTSICSLGCTEPQSLSDYGNYAADVMEGEMDIGDAEIMILKNGAMAYSLRIPDLYYERGFGQLTMTSQTEFDFVTFVDYYGLYRELFSDQFNFWGNGSFSSKSVSLEVPYGLLLNGVIDPAVYAGITMDQLAGTYEGFMPGDMMPRARLYIAEDGSVTGLVGPFLGNQVTGKVTIPGPGANQFQFKFQFIADVQNSYSSIGTFRGDEIYLITKHMIGDEQTGTFDWTLEKQ